uniref:Uncharacterized protein n=1 Tax=Glossina morsitans morsitans TaxID=37546 RepID=A0A1B0G516_GLOMM
MNGMNRPIIKPPRRLWPLNQAGISIRPIRLLHPLQIGPTQQTTQITLTRNMLVVQHRDDW